MQNPNDPIQVLVQQRLSRSEEEILAELRALPVLPDEEDPAWEDARTWEQADRYLALGQVARERRLRPALPLLLERACFGDPGEMMRGLRHILEAIVDPDLEVLLNVCIDAAGSGHRGARLWAIQELGTLRDRRALPTLERALNDSSKEIRSAAQQAIEMIREAR